MTANFLQVTWLLRPSLNISAKPPFSTSGTLQNSAPYSLSLILKNLSMPLSPPGWIIATHFSSGSLARTSNSCSTKLCWRILMGVRKYQHITPILKSLHWLLVQYRIEYKISLLTYHPYTLNNSSLPFPPHAISALDRPISASLWGQGFEQWVTVPFAQEHPVCGTLSLSI